MRKGEQQNIMYKLPYHDSSFKEHVSLGLVYLLLAAHTFQDKTYLYLLVSLKQL